MSLQRLKFTGPIEEDSTVHYKYKSASCSTSTSGPFTYPTAYFYQYMEGRDTPNFHKRVKRGDLIPYTPFRQYLIEGTAEQVRDASKGECMRSYFTGNTGVVASVWQISTGELDEVYSEQVPEMKVLVQAAMADIYTSGFDALTFLAELREIRRLWEGILRTAIDLIKRGRLPNWQQIPDFWLEIRYGWRTLVYDIKEINKLIAGMSDHFVRYRKHLSDSDHDSAIRSESWSRIEGSMDITITDSIDISVRGSVAADIRPSKLRFNPLVTGWELTPYSFVIDWLLTVGRSLESMSGLLIADKYTAAGGCKVTITRTVVGYPQYASGWSGSNSVSAQCIGTASYRMPMSVSTIPHFRLNLDFLKVADLLALLWQAIRGK